jgi:heterodisulfide reductase subunit A
MRRLPKRRQELLQPGMLQPCGKKCPEAQSDQPDMDVTILFRDMRTYGFNEDYYREASSQDVRFIRWTPDDPPRVEAAKADGRSVLGWL